jgi:hypothetical protein
MPRMRNNMLIAAVLLIAVTSLCSVQARAQCSTAAPMTPTSYGYFQWQVDQCATTLTFDSETGFSSPPGLVQIPISIPHATTIHEVHGHFAYAVWTSSCIGSIIAELKDQNGNVIAVTDPLQFGVSTIDIPIKGTFPNGLPVTSLQMQFYQGSCGTFTFSWFLVVS